MHADIETCREAAELCRRLAAEATDPFEKRELLHIADEWLSLPLAPHVVLALKHLAFLS